MPTKIDTREWNRTFEKYVSLRKTARQDIVIEKARDFAFRVFQNIKPVPAGKIEKELLDNKRILRITWYRLKKQFGPDVLKGKAASKRRRAIHKTGKTKKALTPGNKIVRDYAKRLMTSRKKSSGYHRVAFLLAAQKLGREGSAAINPRSRLARTNVSQTHNALRSVVRINAVARGLECPSTNAAVDAALATMKGRMEAEIEKRLAAAKRAAGFTR